jgi:hypothetical protein
MCRAVAGALDATCIFLFVAIGRASQAHGLTIAGMASTSWPFLFGAGAGWVYGRVWRRPGEPAPTGTIIWVTCVGVGMAARMVWGQGTAFAFVLVALAFLGAEVLGWRFIYVVASG